MSQGSGDVVSADGDATIMHLQYKFSRSVCLSLIFTLQKLAILLESMVGFNSLKGAEVMQTDNCNW